MGFNQRELSGFNVFTDLVSTVLALFSRPTRTASYCIPPLQPPIFPHYPQQQQQQQQRASGRSKASSRKSRLSQKERVAISDLSSWGSDDDGSEKAQGSKDQRETGPPKAKGGMMMKHSKGVMDLSKFLRSDDDDDDGGGAREDADDGSSRNREGLLEHHIL